MKALGLIRDDAGDDNSRTEIGKNSKLEKSELCVRSASADRAAREFPVEHKPGMNTQETLWYLWMQMR